VNVCALWLEAAGGVELCKRLGKAAAIRVYATKGDALFEQTPRLVLRGHTHGIGCGFDFTIPFREGGRYPIQRRRYTGSFIAVGPLNG